MPTIKPRVTITMDSEQLDKIEEYRFNHRCKNQTQAILSLIEAGFAEFDTNKENADSIFSKEEIEHIKKYRNLDDHGKEVVDVVLDKETDRMNDEYIEVAARGGKYKLKKDDVLSLAKQLDEDPYEKDHDLC